MLFIHSMLIVYINSDGSIMIIDNKFAFLIINLIEKCKNNLRSKIHCAYKDISINSMLDVYSKNKNIVSILLRKFDNTVKQTENNLGGKYMRKVLLLILALCLFGTVLLAGCTPKEEAADEKPEAADEKAEEDTKEETKDEEADEATSMYSQAPMLDDMDLPPIEERLPLEPKLTNEIDADHLDYQIGKYGGTLRTATAGINWDPDVFVMSNEPLLNTPGIIGKEITGNVLLGYDANSELTEFTFYMREGMKWSDGMPVTTEDVRFTVEDVLMNEELTAIFPVWMRGGGLADADPFVLDVIDEFTFRLTFDRPYGGIIIRFAIQGWRGYTELIKPAHFLKPFHKDYGTMEDIEAKADELLIEKDDLMWVNVFHDMDSTNWELCGPQALGFPVLYPWVKVDTGNEQLYKWERNPYYFKVDADGQQLPYIDAIETTLVQDMEMIQIKIMSGEVDFTRESASLVKMPLYKENEDKGIKAYLAKMHVTPTDIFFNMNYDDADYQEVVRDVRFRKAISLSMDRDEIIDTIYYGFASSGVVLDDTFDLVAANALLDEMGMVIGDDGFRTAPSGNNFEILFETADFAPDVVPLTELVIEMWKELDLNVTMKQIDKTLHGQKRGANEIQVHMLWTHTPLWYMGDWGMGAWAPLWNTWRTSGGVNGEEPPEDVKEFYALIDKLNVVSPEEALGVFEELKANMRENLWYIVHIDDVNQPLVANHLLRNIPHDSFAIAANFSGEQFWFDEE